MKKTDTCYYMSITKEENSAFVVANNQTTGTEFSGVAVETKQNASTADANPVTSTSTSAATTTTTISTTTTTGGNGTALSKGAETHQRCENENNIKETTNRQETCNNNTAPRTTLPPVILQVPLSTSTLQHHNLLASDVHRECCMRLASFFNLFFNLSFLLINFHFLIHKGRLFLLLFVVVIFTNLRNLTFIARCAFESLKINSS